MLPSTARMTCVSTAMSETDDPIAVRAEDGGRRGCFICTCQSLEVLCSAHQLATENTRLSLLSALNACKRLSSGIYVGVCLLDAFHIRRSECDTVGARRAAVSLCRSAKVQLSVQTAMITPRFSCAQTDAAVVVSIYCPSVRVSLDPLHARCDVGVEILEVGIGRRNKRGRVPFQRAHQPVLSAPQLSAPAR